MKTYSLLLVFLILHSLSYSQSLDQIRNEIINDTNQVDCSVLPVKVADLIAEHYLFIDKNLSYDSVSQIINIWTQNCNLSEPLLRLNILMSIKENLPTQKLISSYYKYEFDQVLIDKTINAKQTDFKTIYEENESYYGYVPIDHLFDHFTKDFAGILLTKELTEEEREICSLFNHDFINENYTQNNHSKDDTDSEYVTYDDFENGNSRGVWSISTGMWVPHSKNGATYTPNFMLGVSGGVQNEQFFFNFEVSGRFHGSNYDFDFVVDRDTFAVNSSIAGFFGFNFGFRLVQNKVIGLYGTGGLGLDWLNTDLFKEEKYNEESDEYYDTYYSLAAPHLSTGLSLLFWENHKNIFSIHAKYHLTPVTSSRIISDLPQSAYSIGIKFTF